MVQATHTSRGGESLFYLIFLFPHFAFLSPLLSRATPDKPCMCDFDVQALFLVTLGPKVRAAPHPKPVSSRTLPLGDSHLLRRFRCF